MALPQPLHILPSYSEATDFNFLESSLEGKDIALLGESIHMTHEQPLARIGLMRFLQERKGFDLVAFEGSTIDFWVAMDGYLHSPRKEKDAIKFRKLAFFGLWQTKEMDQVIHSILKTLSESHPVYISSFDIQPGIGFGFRKENLFLSFAQALNRYAPRYNEKKMQALVKPLAPLQFCSGNGFPKDKGQRERALQAVIKLEQWIADATKAVKEKNPGIPHAEALGRIPFSLRQTVDLCTAHQANTDTKNKWAVYQPKRDSLNAEMATQLLEKVSKNHRLIAWAHHSHVNYNSLKRVSMTFGQGLKDRWGSKVYALGVFGGEGAALVGQDEPELKDLRPVADAELDSFLSGLSKKDYYLDLTAPGLEGAELFSRPAAIRIEGIGLWKAQLAKDYDALIYLSKISPPTVDFTPP